MEIGDLIRRAATMYGDDIALVDARRSLSFTQLDEATDRVGHGLPHWPVTHVANMDNSSLHHLVGKRQGGSPIGWI